MNKNTMLHRRRAERFAQLLDEAHGGRRHRVRSHVDPELANLTAVARRVRAVRPAAAIDPGFRTGLRAMLIATAERDGIGAGASTNPVADDGPRRAARTLVRPGLNPRRARARGAIVVGVVAGAIAVSGMSAASENAIPGDALYGMKRSTERAQLALASSDLSRGQLFLDFARTRLAEAIAVRSDTVGFAAVLDDMDADSRQGVKLLTTSAVQRDDTGALDAIGSFVTSHRREVTAMLDGVGRVERERVAASLALLDSIKKRSDGLRATLTCGVEPSIRADALGPLPRPCVSGRQATIGQANGSSQDSRPSERVPNPPRLDQPDATSPTDPPSPASGDLTKMQPPPDRRTAN